VNVLAVDVGGTNVKLLASHATEPRRFASGKEMTPAEMVRQTKEAAGDWKYEVVAMGYPGFVRRGKIMIEPHNLAPGWIDFDFFAAFGCRVKVMNDAAMQALGSYASGFLLFVGLGTGLGSALVDDGVVVPMELGHLSYRKGEIEDFVGARGLARLGVKRWQRHVDALMARLIEAFHPDDVVIGGGNAKRLLTVPAGCRVGDNANAFTGGFRMWDESRPA
jgi:polyphosphate glucokinase